MTSWALKKKRLLGTRQKGWTKGGLEKVSQACQKKT